MQARTLLEVLGAGATVQQQGFFLPICAKGSVVGLNVAEKPQAASCHLPFNTNVVDSPLANVRHSEDYSASCEVRTSVGSGQ